MPPSRKVSSRSKARQPAADPRQIEAFPEQDPILFLGEEPAAKCSFHVKPDPSPRGRSIARLSENNRIVSENLMDVILTLCEDGVLDKSQWAETIVLLSKVADGTE